MSYLALARKWRPRTFPELVGQDHISKALINSLNRQRVHHAYIFTGTRGVGKTSIARIMAKALNCEQGVSGSPCLVCNACTAIEQGRFLDLIEIDAASKTGVEDTRELMDNVAYAPTCGRYKVYLIDEVHMLSQHSFNALLKTLEEPPDHVKFLLATTELQKLPVTVLSRCLQFNLKHLSIETISDKLRFILEQEKISFEEEVLKILAKAARGSMRDALSLLDQAIACAADVLIASETRALLGGTQQEYALQLLQALANVNAKEVLAISRHIAVEGGQFIYVLQEMLEHLHQISVCQAVPDHYFSEGLSDEIQALNSAFEAEEVQLFYQIGLKGLDDILHAPTLSIGFEMVVLRMLTFKPAQIKPCPPLAYQNLPSPSASNAIGLTSKSETSAKTKEHRSSYQNGYMPESLSPVNVPAIDAPMNTLDPINAPLDSFDPLCLLESSIEASQGQSLKNQSTSLATQPKLSPSLSPTAPDNSSAPALGAISEDWPVILKQLKLTGLAHTAAENASIREKKEHAITLCISKGHQSLFTKAVTQRIEQALSAYFHETIQISLEIHEACDQDPKALATPAQKNTIKNQLHQQQAQALLAEDPFLKELTEVFSAEPVPGSIALLDKQA